MKGEERTHERFAATLDALSEHTGRAIAWLTLAMGLTGFVVVVLRYVLDTGFIWMQESMTWMHGIVFMIGAAYTFKHDEHVRVDVLYRRMSDRARAIVDLAGTVFFLLPLCGYLLYETAPYVESAWRVGERSREAGGLPALYLLKAVIPLMAMLLALQGCATILRCVATLRRGRE
jgi:TRAP-type mannitol/chloroaromatic compound transport system permease small subunit